MASLALHRINPSQESLREILRATKLLVGACRFGKESERGDVVQVLRHGLVKASRECVEIVPVAQLALDENKLRQRARVVCVHIERASIPRCGTFKLLVFIGNMTKLHQQVGILRRIGQAVFACCQCLGCAVLCEQGLTQQQARTWVRHLFEDHAGNTLTGERIVSSQLCCGEIQPGAEMGGISACRREIGLACTRNFTSGATCIAQSVARSSMIGRSPGCTGFQLIGHQWPVPVSVP